MTRHDTDATGPRLYGNWRAERGWGIGSLSTSATITLFLAILLPLLAVSTAPGAALPLAAAAAVVVAAVVIRVGGTSAADVLTRRVRFHRARAAGWTELSAGVLTEHPRGVDLPGVLAPLVPLGVEDGRGGRHALLWNRRAGTLSAVLRCSPIGLDLADPDQTDAWVASWGAFLADLGFQPLVRHVAVTVDTVPSSGATVHDHVARELDPGAPPLARCVLGELAQITPATAAAVDVRVTICLDPNRATPKPDDLLAAAIEVARWLPGLETALGACGVAVLGRAGVGWLTGRIRGAFDPAVHSDVTRTGEASEVLAWADAGPVAARESWDHYRHDSGLSVSWGLREAPRQAVGASVLAPLLAPGPFARRLTWLYQPYPADQAAAKVEAEVTSGQIRRAWAARTRRDETQRERDDRDRALQSAREEAEGAGVGRFTVYITTTVQHDGDLDAAVADVEQRSGQAKLRLRRLHGSQAAGFAAALGLGIDPAELIAHRGGR
ncbi:SCO6880 family protein [Pseudonocardia nigra]|uniref:SCO6880 family protein n=1 Tax=Pseudonocardia nigra TaxID=1921578 RepID=UPI001C5D3DF4|nr:SCO6880 family protein [Pseudonocardia nigra]